MYMCDKGEGREGGELGYGGIYGGIRARILLCIYYDCMGICLGMFVYVYVGVRGSWWLGLGYGYGCVCVCM